MSRPLPPGDPGQLGPYRLSARLSESAAGIVYLGVDGAGRRASVAVLTRGAAEDAAARDRFRAAIAAALPGGVPGGAGGVPGPWGPMAVPGPAEGAGGAPVVAAQPEGPAPWVATAYEPERAGAERFLEPVLLEEGARGRWGGRRRGPQFQPYWLGSAEPALARPPVGTQVPVPEQRRERGLVAAILTLAAVLVVLALLMLVLFACQPQVRQPPPPPPEPTPSSSSPSPSPSMSPSPSPSPAPTTPGPPSPAPTGSEGEGGDGDPL
ncbi:hypothetical protein [Actinomadura hibisca]|uniref:hypothetical protein n=1 Tax=Actinomadura hibisca TaxID=68565 RepID=UPI00082C25F3|nr:hypothetical protein [Actinomadura hibisca]